MNGKYVKQGIAGLVVLSFFGMWLAMEWTAREPDGLIMLGAVAIVLGAAYYLWDDAMARGAETARNLRDDEE